MRPYEQLGIDQMPVSDKEDLLRLLVSDLAAGHRYFTPLFPWVLVRVLPRNAKYGSLVLPEKQNKVTHEGIVLATWQARIRHIVETSDLLPGDHVLFPHFAGLPVVGYDAEKYRIVKETNWAKDGDGGIFAVIEHTETPNLWTEVLGSIECQEVPQTSEQICKRLDDRYVLVDKLHRAVTMSGK